MISNMDCFQVLLSLFCLTCVVLHTGCSAQTLYSGNDPVVQLDTQTFQNTIVRSETAWVVEFYSAWCGHCQRFAPIYKQFANDVSGWSTVIRVAAVACSEPKNQIICRQQNVKSYPTIKFFPANLRSLTHGFWLNSLHFSAESVRTATIKFIEERMTPSPTQPTLTRFSDISALKSSTAGYTPRHLLAIFENDDATNTELSKLIILDLSSHRPDVIIGRLPLSSMPNPSLVGQSRPILTAVFGNGVRYISQLDTREEAVRLIQTLASEQGTHYKGTHTGGLSGGYVPAQEPHHHDRGYSATENPHHRQKHQTQPPRPSRPPTTVTTLATTTTKSSAMEISQEDLDSNIYYSLWNEAPSRTTIRGKALPALKNYIAALAKYHPGNDRLISFLTDVHRWIQRIGGSLRSELYLNTIDGLQSSDSYVVKELDWNVCQGSLDRFRGYPCSLWMTFHSLTVAAYENHLQHPSEPFNPVDVLNVIRKYVKYFFSCRECSEHFLAMSKRLNREINRPQDGVLWLWKAHNRVNNRLHGDTTEDPNHPKIQFPSAESCPTCRYDNKLPHDRFDNDTLWNEVEMLNFLREFYAPVQGQSSRSPIGTGPTSQVSQWTSPMSTPTSGSGLLNNGTCIRRQSPWTGCSASCDIGVSTRFINSNDDCEMRMEMRICQIRPCEALAPNLNYRTSSGQSLCTANIQDNNRKTLTFNNCTTTSSYRWRYCGQCTGYCCEPSSTGSLLADMTCEGGHSGKARILWIKRCSCRSC